MGKDGKGEKRKKSKDEKKKHKRARHEEKKHKRSREEKKRSKNSSAGGKERVTESISSEDFFRLSEEFRVWLKMAKNRSLDEISSLDARDLFQKFVELWNSKQLSMMYYDGIPSEIRDAYIKTSHKWGIQLSEAEKNKLIDTSEEVERKTRRRTENAWTHMAPPLSLSASAYCLPARLDPTGGKPESVATTTLKRESEIDEERDKVKRQRISQRDYIDEVAPKETGRLAAADQRRGNAVRIHGAFLDKESSKDGLDIAENETFGGGDDFASMKAARDRRKQQRESEVAERLRDLQDQERKKSIRAMEQLGIDLSKGKIVIPPRADQL